jgi:hypothetical protein
MIRRKYVPNANGHFPAWVGVAASRNIGGMGENTPVRFPMVRFYGELLRETLSRFREKAEGWEFWATKLGWIVGPLVGGLLRLPPATTMKDSAPWIGAALFVTWVFYVLLRANFLRFRKLDEENALLKTKPALAIRVKRVDVFGRMSKQAGAICTLRDVLITNPGDKPLSVELQLWAPAAAHPGVYSMVTLTESQKYEKAWGVVGEGVELKAPVNIAAGLSVQGDAAFVLPPAGTVPDPSTMGHGYNFDKVALAAVHAIHGPLAYWSASDPEPMLIIPPSLRPPGFPKRLGGP